jgi:hypothetical protein
MPHVIERSPSGRAACRGCGAKIASGDLRFGERMPNPFADDGGEMTHWFHVPCAAFTRPEPFHEILAAGADAGPERERLEREAQAGIAHRRLPRVRAASRAPTGRASCRACRQSIAKGAWRIALAYYEDGRFVPSGFIHVRCAPAYLETADIVDRLRHFSPDLADTDVEEIRVELSAESPVPRAQRQAPGS